MFKCALKINTNLTNNPIEKCLKRCLDISQRRAYEWPTDMQKADDVIGRIMPIILY